MRHKILLLALPVICVLALAGCGKGGAVSGDKMEDFSGTMMDLIRRGKSVHCTYQMSANGVAQSGDIYIAGDKSRTDMETNMASAGTNMKVHALSFKNEQYVWDEKNNMGIKVAMTLEEQQRLSEEAKKNNSQTAVSSQAPDLGVNMNFKCLPWSVDEAMFKVPTDIKFNDMTDLMKGLTQPAAAGSNSMCAVCNSVPAGAARDACKKSACK